MHQLHTLECWSVLLAAPLLDPRWENTASAMMAMVMFQEKLGRPKILQQSLAYVFQGKLRSESTGEVTSM